MRCLWQTLHQRAMLTDRRCRRHQAARTGKSAPCEVRHEPNTHSPQPRHPPCGAMRVRRSLVLE